VWHMARDEDGEVHVFAQHTRPIWQRDAWYQKLGLPGRGRWVRLHGGAGGHFATVRHSRLPGILRGRSPRHITVSRCADPGGFGALS
jgi:hypothetical protein